MTLPSSSERIEASYRHCASVARNSGSSFVWAFWLVRKEERQAMQSLYALARHTDDLADSDEPASARRAALIAWKSELTTALDEGASEDPILASVAHMQQRFDVPKDYLLAIVDGCEQDLQHEGYETFADLQGYCWNVASAVGLCCGHIWQAREVDPEGPAADCGYAMQLTNILRDVREDRRLGRVYLPREEMRRFEVTEAMLSESVMQPQLRELIDFEIARARKYYVSSLAFHALLPKRSQPIFRAMHSYYRHLLERIALDPAAILAKRVRLTNLDRLGVLREVFCGFSATGQRVRREVAHE